MIPGRVTWLAAGLLLASAARAQFPLFAVSLENYSDYYSVGGAGDVDGDGVPDLIVGYPEYGPGSCPKTMGKGMVRIYSGKTGAVLHSLATLMCDTEFGLAVAGAGDLNGDGHADCIIGAPTFLAGYALAVSGADGSVLFRIDGVETYVHLGAAVAAAGDVNLDGHDDVIIGAPGLGWSFDGTPPLSGSVTVYSGIDGSPLLTVTGRQSGDHFGASVASAGDVDRDGYPDLVVGANHFFQPDQPCYVQVLSGHTGEVLHEFEGSTEIFVGGGDGFGSFVDGAGDVNNDGFPDIIVGLTHVAASSDPGKARVYSGKDGSLLLGLIGTQDCGDAPAWPYRVSGLGDVNLDGCADVLVATMSCGLQAMGAADLFSGCDGSVLGTVYGAPNGLFFAYAISELGDLTGDGIADFAVGTFASMVAFKTVVPAAGDPAWHVIPAWISGSTGKPVLAGHGALSAGANVGLDLTHALEGAQGRLCLGLAAGNVPFKGGILVPTLDLSVAFVVGAGGAVAWSAVWPAAIPPGTKIYMQALVLDPLAIQGVASSNALMVAAG